jgi:hypothetical protein
LCQYYLGIALSRAGQNDQAYRHFFSANNLSPSTQIGQYARVACERLHAVSNKPSHENISAVESPEDSDAELGSSVPVDAITRQLGDRSSRLEKQTKFQIERVLTGDDQMIKQFNSDAVAELGRTKNYSYERAVDTRAWLKEQKSRLEDLRGSHLRETQTSLENTSSGLRDSAKALQSQINKRTSLGSIQLSPIGTNLYVRSYAAADKDLHNSKKLPAELLADQDKLELSEHKMNAYSAEQDMLLLKQKNKSRSEQLNVAGKLLRK